jgi:hypothetical protein
MKRTRLGGTVSWKSSTSYKERNDRDWSEEDLGVEHNLYRRRKIGYLSGARED